MCALLIASLKTISSQSEAQVTRPICSRYSVGVMKHGSERKPVTVSIELSRLCSTRCTKPSRNRRAPAEKCSGTAAQTRSSAGGMSAVTARPTCSCPRIGYPHWAARAAVIWRSVANPRRSRVASSSSRCSLLSVMAIRSWSPVRVPFDSITRPIDSRGFAAAQWSVRRAAPQAASARPRQSTPGCSTTGRQGLCRRGSARCASAACSGSPQTRTPSICSSIPGQSRAAAR